MRTTQRMTDDSDDTMTQYTINDATCPPTEASDLRRIVQKHIETLPKYLTSKPIARYNVEAFEEACQFVKLRQFNENKRVNVILDSGCGTGRSTRLLGEMFPDCAVIGIE
jgi:tRNA G46 methylase TrmB